ncbi:MAG: hypothetical protein R2706_20455 [Acidimicrobiales bacterium]
MTRPVWRVVNGAVSAALAVALWLPWVYFGSATRTSFGVFRSAQRLGFDELAPFRIGWFLLPVAAGGVVLLTILGHRRLSSLGLGALGLVVGFPALVVVWAGGAAWGANVALALAVVSELGATWSISRRSGAMAD